MAVALRAPPPRAGRRAALARLLAGWVSLQTKNTNQNTSRPRVGRLGNVRGVRRVLVMRGRREAGVLMIKVAIDTGVVVSRWRARGGSRLPSLPAPCSTKGWRAGPTGPPHTRTHHCRTTPHPTATRTTNAEPRTLCALLLLLPLGGASPPHTDPCPLSLSLVHSHRAAHRSHVRWRTLCAPQHMLPHATCRPRPDALAASAPSLRPPSLSCHCQPPSRGSSRGGAQGKGARAPFRSPHHLIQAPLPMPPPPHHSSAPATIHPPNTNAKPNKSMPPNERECHCAALSTLLLRPCRPLPFMGAPCLHTLDPCHSRSLVHSPC